MTVLFADVVRSMAIAAAVDAERLRDIVTELAERSAAVVRHYGGTVEFTGATNHRPDSFGAPAYQSVCGLWAVRLLRGRAAFCWTAIRAAR